MSTLRKREFEFVGLALSLLFGCTCAWAQVASKKQSKKLSVSNAKKHKSKSSPQAIKLSDNPKQNPYATPHSRYVFRLGQAFQKRLPAGWRMDWESTSLRKVQWQAGSQEGHKIRFSHVTKKVLVPVPFPNFRQLGKKNTEVVPMRCTLHFFPRQGIYRAYDNRINRMTPAEIVAITPKAIVFLPNRFLAKEFPCPEILKRFRRHTRALRFGRRVPRRWIRTLTKLGLSKGKIRRFRNYVQLSFIGAPRPLPWKKLIRAFSHSTLVVKFSDPINNWTTIYNS